MTNHHQIQTVAIEQEKSHNDRLMTADEVARMARDHHVWQCPGCEHTIRFKASQVEAIPFFIVRHLLRIHDVEPERIIQAEPALTDEVRDYCRQMSVTG